MISLAPILIVCWVLFPSLLYVAGRKTNDFPPWEHWLVHPILFLVMWYVIATAVDQIRHGPYEAGTVWLSSFVVSALFASAVFPLAFQDARGARWFLVFAFLTATVVFGLFFQLLSWFLPRYTSVLIGLF